ncbi:hypothetical protein SADUNF_Sadunf15G0120000 [Salix dunnii]|uniref:Uncharacterized protein n=1 Tax=Salix dunnii TaxID=1413687 RepID=A0A835JD85_9ROSI|nr:hypothetical protein SADUNF_Sadunf15G0120000 [Salix dunnii]
MDLVSRRGTFVSNGNSFARMKKLVYAWILLSGLRMPPFFIVSYNYIKHATSFDLSTFLFCTPCTTSQVGTHCISITWKNRPRKCLTSIGPKLQINQSSSSDPINIKCESPSSCHMVQWESASSGGGSFVNAVLARKAYTNS